MPRSARNPPRVVSLQTSFARLSRRSQSKNNPPFNAPFSPESPPLDARNLSWKTICYSNFFVASTYHSDLKWAALPPPQSLTSPSHNYKPPKLHPQFCVRRKLLLPRRKLKLPRTRNTTEFPSKARWSSPANPNSSRWVATEFCIRCDLGGTGFRK